MPENATILTNQMILANLIDIITIIGTIASIFVVVGLVFKYIHYRRKKKAAKKEIIKHLERFISTEEDNISKIDNRHQEKIAEVGNDFKTTLVNIDKNKILFSKNILEELFSFRDKIRDLSEIRLVSSKARGLNQNFENIQIQTRGEKGKELIEEAREFITKIE
jgi:hypothetical protein